MKQHTSSSLFWRRNRILRCLGMFIIRPPMSIALNQTQRKPPSKPRKRSRRKSNKSGGRRHPWTSADIGLSWFPTINSGPKSDSPTQYSGAGRDIDCGCTRLCDVFGTLNHWSGHLRSFDLEPIPSDGSLRRGALSAFYRAQAWWMMEYS